MTSLELGIWALVILVALIFFRLGHFKNMVGLAPSHHAADEIIKKLDEITRRLSKQ